MIKMPTIVGILTFMSRINFVHSWVENRKRFLTSGQGYIFQYNYTSVQPVHWIMVLITCLTLNALFLLVWYNKLQKVHCIYWNIGNTLWEIITCDPQVIISHNVFPLLKIVFVIANIVDPDEMPHYTHICWMEFPIIIDGKSPYQLIGVPSYFSLYFILS